MSDDAKRAGANAESEPLNLRIPLALAEELRKFAKTLPIVSKHRIAVEALKLGFASIQADPSILLRGAVMPSTSAPATPAAPAPSPAVAAPAAPVAAPPVAPVVPVADPRQLPLLAPGAPVVATHTSTSGLSVATVTGNDNGAAPAKPVEAPLPDIDLDALKVRVRAAITAGRSERSICLAAGLSESALNAWLNKPGRGLRQETAHKVDRVLRGLGF